MKFDRFDRAAVAACLSVVLLAGLVTACTSGPPPEVCAQFDLAIDRSIVEIAMSAAAGASADKSAIQQGARMTQANNRLNTILINVQLQAQHKCLPRARPVDPFVYSREAANCESARLTGLLAQLKSDAEKIAAETEASAACDLKRWDSRAK